ncbi:hypothetical protein BRC81_11335 [Halobacteriales archaeon QS_1_68_20]|nr:MAG: hypothetical protein BRC81_11335 [Halobacteriales archaeon QS_1_68_20]
MIGYLFENEVPKYVLLSQNNLDVVCRGEEVDYGLSAVSVITDSIPLSAVTDVELKTGLILSRIVFETANGNRYEIQSLSAKSTEAETVEFVERSDGNRQAELDEAHHEPDGELEYVCRECNGRIDEDATRCPHCGFAPEMKKKGAPWHGTALATSFSPLGWAMMAKGAADELAARGGVGEEVLVDGSETDGDVAETDEDTEVDALDKLERLAELNDDGVISDEEFEQQKRELLEEI